jgi:outer membrane immunogenic protein
MSKRVFVASRLAFAFALTAAAWGPANAADLGPYNRGYKDYSKDYGEPIVVPAYFSWTGFYIGGHLGYGWGSSSSFNKPGRGNGDAFNGVDGVTSHPYGWMGGVSLGYNWQSDAFVFGVEGDLGYLGAEDTERTANAFSSADYGGYGALTARIGYAQDRWMFYGKGGLAFADIENKAGFISGGAIDPTDFTSVHEVRTGWALGAGVEYAFQRDLSMKIEYLYMDFGQDRSGNFDGDVFGHENDIHTVKVGLNYSLQSVVEPLK